MSRSSRLAWRLLVSTLVVLAAHGAADARKGTPCPDGRFVQATRLLPGGSDAAFDAIVLADGQLWIDSGCGPTQPRLRVAKDGSTRVRARWRSCGDLKKVRLTATIGDDGVACHRLVGTLRAKRMPKVSVAATRSACGDGIVDAASGETCDPPGAGCSDRCVATPTGGAIVAPARTWTWVPFADSACANGAPTGIGVNPGEPGGRLFIFLNGGGACWDETTCYTIGLATYVTSGYGATQFAADAASALDASFWNRNDPSNPFRNDSFVFVPYCTGDVHAGSNPDANWGGHPTKHVGFQNMTAFLRRIVPTFAGASRVILSGSSAGGFGALANWWQTQQAFGALRVDLLDDSGPPLPSPYLQESLEQTWRNAWNLAAATPPGCTQCATDLDAVVAWYGANMTGRRAALLSYTQDPVIGAFYGLGGTQVQAGLNALLAEMAPYDVWRHFVVAGATHTMLGTPDVAQNGVSVRTWVTQMVTDDPAWASVTPP